MRVEEGAWHKVVKEGADSVVPMDVYQPQDSCIDEGGFDLLDICQYWTEN